MAGHPWEPSIWRGLETSSHEAPVEALSSKEGDRTARCSQGTLAYLGPASRVQGGHAGVLTSPALASSSRPVPASTCQQVLSAVRWLSNCLSSESLDSTFKQRH